MNGGAARSAWWWLAAIVTLTVGCLVDKDKPCDVNQVELDETFVGCACVPGTVPNKAGNGCVPCGANEQESMGACLCIPGYRKPTGGTVCEPIPDSGGADGGSDSGSAAGNSGEGMSCTSAADCANFDATYCLTLSMPSVCLVQGCATGQRKCSGERVCCNSPFFSGTNGLCLPADGCSRAMGTVVTP